MAARQFSVRVGNGRVSALDDTGDLAAPPGTTPWAQAVLLELQHALTQVEGKSGHFAQMMHLFQEHRGWELLLDAGGQPFRSFPHFCLARQPFGLGVDPGHVMRLMAKEDDVPIQAALEEATQRPLGTNQYSEGFDNIQTLPTPTGTSRQSGLRWLRTHRPDLHGRVLAGELTVHAACVAAGHRKPRVTIALDPERAAATIREHFGPDELRLLIAHLMGDVHP